MVKRSMNLSALFPRPLNAPQQNSYSDECAAVLGALFVRAYFERGAAWRMGWRGILPNSAALPAWTCRVAGSEHTYGILFDGEEALGTHGSGGATGIRGRFSLFVFPEANSPLLEQFPLRALSVALRSGYGLFMRNFATDVNLQEAMAFQVGTLNMEMALDGSGLAFVLEAPIRRRIISLDGLFAVGGQCVIPPGGAEVDYPAFRLLLPLFGLLAKSLEEIFTENCTYSSGHLPWMGEAFDRQGQLRNLTEHSGVLERMQAQIGYPVAGGTVLLRSLSFLPLKAERNRTVINEHRPVLHMLTGFLGSGKTTLLKEWLNFLHDKNRFTGVMQNEFGKVGLDALLLKGEAVVEELDEGCVCCSLADSLRPGLQRLLAELPARECILETTGLANPEYVLEALEDLSDIAVPGLVITLVDALELAPSLQAASGSALPELPEFEGIRKAQIASADVLVLNKADAVKPCELEAIAASLVKLNGRAEIMLAEWGRIPFARLDAIYEKREAGRNRAAQASQSKAAIGGLRKYGSSSQTTAAFNLLPLEDAISAQPHHREHTHEQEGYGSRLLEFEGALALEDLMSLLKKFMPQMCRIKGLVDISGEGPTTVQYAAGQLLLEPYLQKTEHCGYLVLIGNGSTRAVSK